MSLCVRFSMKPLQRLLIATPAAALLPVVMAPASSLANDVQLNLESVQEYSIAQGATIRDFSDVYPTDWAYQAVANLIENYGCVSGFPDGTFRGNQPITRFQMAALLNSCLDSISAKMDMMDEEMKSMEDMDTLERLMASFEEEIIVLKGKMDGLDAKVSELEDSQFSTTTKGSFKIATDFTYFSSDDKAAREPRLNEEKTKRTYFDNSGLALSSEVKLAFETSFTGSDTLSFSLTGDLMSMGEGNYLVSDDFYGKAGDEGPAGFSGFVYETNLDLGGMMTTLVFGTDYADFDGLVGLDTYYGGGGYDHYGSSGELGDVGDAGIGVGLELLSSDAGTVTASASYAVVGTDASNETGPKGIFGEDTDYSIAGALSWDGALFGSNEAMITGMFRYVDHNNVPMYPTKNGGAADVQQTDWKIVAGAYLTDTLSVSGSYASGSQDVRLKGKHDYDIAQWMVAVNLDDVIFPDSSAGFAYGTAQYVTAPAASETKEIPTVLEFYYSFSVNDNFEVPIYLDLISNAAEMSDSNAFAVAVRPTLTF